MIILKARLFGAVGSIFYNMLINNKYFNSPYFKDWPGVIVAGAITPQKGAI